MYCVLKENTIRIEESVDLKRLMHLTASRREQRSGRQGEEFFGPPFCSAQEVQASNNLALTPAQITASMRAASMVQSGTSIHPARYKGGGGFRGRVALIRGPGMTAMPLLQNLKSREREGSLSGTAGSD